MSEESPSFSLLRQSLSSSQGTSPLSTESTTHHPAQELFQAHLLASHQTTQAIRSNVDQSTENLRKLWSKCPIEYRWQAWASPYPSETHLEDSRQEFQAAEKFNLETGDTRADSPVRITCPDDRTAFRPYRPGLPRSLPDSRLLVTEAPFWTGTTTIDGRGKETFPTSGSDSHVTDHRLLRSESLPEDFYQRAYLESHASTGGVLLPYRRGSTRQVMTRYCEPPVVNGWISFDSRHFSPKRDKSIGEVWRPY